MENSNLKFKNLDILDSFDSTQSQTALNENSSNLFEKSKTAQILEFYDRTNKLLLEFKKSNNFNLLDKNKEKDKNCNAGEFNFSKIDKLFENLIMDPFDNLMHYIKTLKKEMVQKFEDLKQEILLLSKNEKNSLKNKDSLDFIKIIEQNINHDTKFIDNLRQNLSTVDLEIFNKFSSQEFQNETLKKYFNYYMTLLDFKNLEEDTNDQNFNSFYTFYFE
jgi:hypothetical protein